VAYRPPALVGQIHPDQDVAGHPDAVDQLALAVLDLGDALHGDLHVEDVRLHVQGGHAGQKVGLDPVLIARVGVDDEPVTLLDAKPGAERSLVLDVTVRVTLHVSRLGRAIDVDRHGGLWGRVVDVVVDGSLLGRVGVLLAQGGLVGGDLGGRLLRQLVTCFLASGADVLVCCACDAVLVTLCL